MLKKAVIVLAILLLALVLVIAMQPSEFRVTRSAAISAPPAVVYAQISDFRNWEAWSPWAKKDPGMKQTYEGSGGTGAVYTWAGNHEVGEGRMTIIESRPNELVRIKLEFFKPFAATNKVEFILTPVDGETDLTWSMHGEKSFMSKAVGFFMDVDQMIGDDFEKGLASLQKSATTKAQD